MPGGMTAASVDERQGLMSEGRAIVEPRSLQRTLLSLLLAGAAAAAVAAAARVAPAGTRRGSAAAARIEEGRTLLEERRHLQEGEPPDGYDDPAARSKHPVSRRKQAEPRPHSKRAAAALKQAHERKNQDKAHERKEQDYTGSDGAYSPYGQYGGYGGGGGYGGEGGYTGAAAPVPAPAAASGGDAGGACLCIFDVDRTLTAKQGKQSDCRFTWGPEDAYDSAFGGGPLLLSYLGKSVSASDCGSCQKGIVSNGDASGPKERAIIAQQLGHDGSEFTSWKSASSPFLTGCPNGQKQECAKKLIAWFESQSIHIDRSRVYMFDDLAQNIAGFEGSGMNAHQVSCDSRDDHDGKLGLCGGRPEELSLATGVTFCGARA